MLYANGKGLPLRDGPFHSQKWASFPKMGKGRRTYGPARRPPKAGVYGPTPSFGSLWFLEFGPVVFGDGGVAGGAETAAAARAPGRRRGRRVGRGLVMLHLAHLEPRHEAE